LLLIIILLAFSLFIFTPLTIHLVLKKKPEKEYFEVDIKYFKFSIIKFMFTQTELDVKNLIPFLSFQVQFAHKKNARKYKKVVSHKRYDYAFLFSVLKQTLHIFKRFWRFVKFLLSSIKLIKASINLKFGCGDPALTSIFVGQIWALIFWALSLISMYLDFRDSDINVNIVPVFLDNQAIEINCKGIITLRVVHIISVGVLLITAYLLALKKSNNILKGAKKYGWTSN
jgi:hypothetical protein